MKYLTFDSDLQLKQMNNLFPIWQKNSDYINEEDFVIYDHNIYMCINTHKSNNDFDIVKWKCISNNEELFESYTAQMKDVMINVKMFGAVGDGVTDDTVAIQACFDNILPDSIIYFPHGTYIVSGIKLLQKEHIKIIGNGILKLKDNSNNPILTLEKCPRISIENLIIDGNKDKQTTNCPGVVFKNSYFSTFINNRISNCKGDGIQILAYYENNVFLGNDEVNINNCFIQLNSGHGIYIDSVSDLNINNSNIEFNNSDGIYITQTTGIGSGNITIANNQILSNDLIGIELIQDCTRIIINQNHIRNNGQAGLRYVGGKEFNISNNDIHLNGRLANYSAGITIGYTSKGILTNNIITCTDFTFTQGYAISINTASNIRIANNIVTDNLNQGIFISSDSTDIISRNNIGAVDI